jgi:uncharacterized protein YecT (DUF1311 family)
MIAMKKLLIVLAATAALAPAAHAADSGKPDCDSGRTPDIVACVRIETAQWDKRMNAAYQKALKEGEAPRQEQLRTAQRLWIQFRDANCLYFDMGEGTIASIDAAECVRNMTEARTHELEEFGQH